MTKSTVYKVIVRYGGNYLMYGKQYSDFKGRNGLESDFKGAKEPFSLFSPLNLFTFGKQEPKNIYTRPPALSFLFINIYTLYLHVKTSSYLQSFLK